MAPEVIEGREIAGRYRVERVLGQGGMGMVLRARHLWTGRAVALKVILPELASSAAAAARFLLEAQTAASLRHPNVVDILDMGRAEDGTLFLAMELLEGEPLSARLARLGKLSPEDALTLLLPILDALALAHEHGLVHRDLKPDNIFLSTGAGPLTPKLLDFGIVRAFRAEGEKLTATGMVLGTPGYMAPEQMAGDPAGPPADVWAIGTVLFEALAGRGPYEFTSALQWMTRVITEPAPSLSSVAPQVPLHLVGIVDRCLLREPSARFADAGELGRALRERSTDALARTVALPSQVPGRIERAAAEIPGAAIPRAVVPTQPMPLGTSPERRRPWRAVVVVSAAMSLAGATGALAWWTQRDPVASSEITSLDLDRARRHDPDAGASERAEGARATSGVETNERAASDTEMRERGDTRTIPASEEGPASGRAARGGSRAAPDRAGSARVDRSVGRRAPRTTTEDM
jgi:serine/threonine-protein kinase